MRSGGCANIAPMFLTPALMLWVATPPAVDAFLPDHLRPSVEAAARAELDPKRGPANALRVLERAQREAAKSEADRVTLQLRVAALELRRTFLSESKLEESKRYEQALSTFSRLDLAEPGFAAWLERTLEHRPEVAAALEASSRLEIAVLTRGPIDRELVQKALGSAVDASRLDIDLAFGSPQSADYLMKVRAENITRAGRQPAVGLRVTLQSTRDESLGSAQQLRRAIRAEDPEAAAKAGAKWVAHIGGRDLVARFLADKGLTMMVLGPLSGGAVPGLPMPNRHGHDRGHHERHAPPTGRPSRP